MTRIIEENTIANGRGRLCDDVSGYGKNIFFVLDGATPLFDDNVFSKTSDVYDFINELRNTLVEQITIDSNASLTDILRFAIKNADIRLSVPASMLECEGPNYTVAMIRINDDDIDYYVCADSSIFIEANQSLKVITDKRFTPFEAENTRRIALLEDNDQKEALKKEIYRETRHKANQPGGYLVTSVNPQSAENGLVGKISKTGVRKILLCTDGFTKKDYPYRNLDLDHVLEHKKLSISVPQHDDITYMLIEL